MRVALYTAAILLTLLFLSPVASAQKCSGYGPTVSLKGRLRSQVFPGPPNYESIKSGDQTERAVILELSSTICVASGSANSFDVAESNIREVQLLVNRSDHRKSVERLLKKRVLIKGALFHAHTGHHRTRILIDVSDIKRI